MKRISRQRGVALLIVLVVLAMLLSKLTCTSSAFAASAMPMSVACVAASRNETLPATSADTSPERSIASEPTSMTASTTSTMMRVAPLWR